MSIFFTECCYTIRRPAKQAKIDAEHANDSIGGYGDFCTFSG